MFKMLDSTVVNAWTEGRATTFIGL